MEGAASQSGEAEAAIRALSAGCDLLLYPKHPQELSVALDRAVRSGELAIRRVDEALARVERAAQLALYHQDYSAMGHAAIADKAGELAAWSVFAVRGEPPMLPERVRLDIVDDDVGGPYPLPPRDAFGAELSARGITIAPDGMPIVLLFADVKGWKGRAGLSDVSRARLAALVPRAAIVIVFGHPRRAADLEHADVVLCAWSGDVGMQRAAAQALVEGLYPF
jgi:hypothetical protein